EQPYTASLLQNQGRFEGKNVCVLMLLCVPLTMMDIPGPCKHAITMDHLLQLKQLISNQLRTGCSITYTFIERKHLSVVCYVKATLPRVLELFNVHFKYVRGSGSAHAVVSIQNLILNIYSQHCIPSLNEELEDPVAFERQYNESPVQALQRVEEVLSLYLHLITTTNTPVNWTCEQEYSSNLTRKGNRVAKRWKISSKFQKYSRNFGNFPGFFWNIPRIFGKFPEIYHPFATLKGNHSVIVGFSCQSTKWMLLFKCEQHLTVKA
uniref:Colony stimulating factor 1b (macrophage) n=1 Tax=Sinocyclocheilus rhinocerous TaxID=307959 RepID=A0A673LYS6_9TELE